MKFCTLLICCCVLIGQNVIGQEEEVTTGEFETSDQYQDNYRENKPQNLSTTKLFSSGLYEEVKKNHPQNFVLSPLSLTNALAMVGLAAGGETAEEILKSLGANSSTELIQRQSNLIRSLKEISAGNSSVKFVSADKIYAQSGWTLKTEYQNDVKKLGGEIETVDFVMGEEAAGNINAWVKNKTEEKIKKLVEPLDLSSGISLFVLNAIYFKGSWGNKFDKTSTRKESFFLNGSCSVNVEMMTQKNEFQLADLQEAKAQVILLPYEGGRLSMMVYLPKGKEEGALDSLENWLADKSPFDIQKKRLNDSYIQDVILSLPKFKIRSSLDLNEPLKNLRLGKMFEPGTADFSGIFRESSDLYVSKVKQETFIEVNEEGTEAAAATGIGLAATSFSSTPEFTVNRPFLFQIVDFQTKTVFFSGRVKNPLDSGSGDSTASADQKNESTCLNSKEVETTNTSKSIDTAGNEAKFSCQGNQNSDVEKLLTDFCDVTSLSNSTAELKNNDNATTPIARLEHCLKEKATEKSRGKDQGNSSPAPLAAASGYYWRENNTIIPDWNYDSTKNGSCFPFARDLRSVIINGTSCVTLYKDKRCKKEKFRVTTTRASVGQDIRFPIESELIPKSIGVCSSFGF